MSALATEFRHAYINGSGPNLAAVLTPIATPNDPNRLRSFYQDVNAHHLTKDLASLLFHGKYPKVPKPEQNAWVEIFAAYWEAVGEVLKVEDRRGGNAAAIFTAWNKLASALIRGYSAPYSIPAWTLPCLYTVGKYLRTFAIKADTEVALKGSTGFGFQEDDADVGKNANLEEAARVLNRMFTLCLSDRLVAALFYLKTKWLIGYSAPIEESRKWGLYNTTNLMFKTYFKVRAIAPNLGVYELLANFA